MKAIFDTTSYKAAQLVTQHYSTSFSLGIKLLDTSIQNEIYAIYGFVRYADEIVDSFQDYNQEELLNQFEADYAYAVKNKISLNPILNAFQHVVNRYDLGELVVSFLKSMRMDLHKTDYLSTAEYQDYIYGSADVVGLMCLKVFVQGNNEEYEKMKPFAMRLGSAFQKVNFLRDYSADTEKLGRSYFPNIQMDVMNNATKNEIIKDIEADFHQGLLGIKQLPSNCKLGVYSAYSLFKMLLFKIKTKDVSEILNDRISVSVLSKLSLLCQAYVKVKLNRV